VKRTRPYTIETYTPHLKDMRYQVNNICITTWKERYHHEWNEHFCVHFSNQNVLFIIIMWYTI